jgi:hypothetical protein
MPFPLGLSNSFLTGFLDFIFTPDPNYSPLGNRVMDDLMLQTYIGSKSTNAMPEDLEQTPSPPQSLQRSHIKQGPNKFVTSVPPFSTQVTLGFF